MKGLIFGAGNIGRGFLGLLLAKANYQVTFVDVDTQKVTQINTLREYPVYVVSDHGTTEEVVRDARAIEARNIPSIVDAIVEADIILTAVGKDALAYLAPSLALGLQERIKRRPNSETHVVVIACENVQDNTTYLRDLVLNRIPIDLRASVSELMSFPNCVVDRIVPNMSPRTSLSEIAVTVEDYFQPAIDGDALRAPFPHIAGVDISINLSATLEQKLCTLNMAHAIVGYYGYLKGYQFVHEAIEDSTIAELLDGALDEVSITIANRHPSIELESQKTYAKKVINRFRNPFLRDEITRVARQPARKLGPEDRLVRPAILTWEQGRIPAFLASGITAALHYDFGGDAQAQSLVSQIRDQGIERVLHEISGLTPNSEIGRLVKSDFLLRAL